MLAGTELDAFLDGNRLVGIPGIIGSLRHGNFIRNRLVIDIELECRSGIASGNTSFDIVFAFSLHIDCVFEPFASLRVAKSNAITRLV